MLPMADGGLSVSVGLNAPTAAACWVGSADDSGRWVESPFFGLPEAPVLLGFAPGLFERAAAVFVAWASAAVEAEASGVADEVPDVPDPGVPEVEVPELGFADFVEGVFGPDVCVGVFAVGGLPDFVGPAGFAGFVGVAFGGGVEVGVALGGVGLGVGAWACTGAAMPGGPVAPPCQDQPTEPPSGTVRPWAPREE